MDEQIEQPKPKPEADDNKESLLLSFEERIEGLVNRGQKRGKRYSVIGIVSSLVITAGVIASGYYLFSQITGITDKVDKQEDTANFQNVIDPDGRCKGESCCLASLERIRKNGYKEADKDGNCDTGFSVKGLVCDNSLKWCEIDGSKAETPGLASISSSTDLVAGTSTLDQEQASGSSALADVDMQKATGTMPAAVSDNPGLGSSTPSLYSTAVPGKDSDNDGLGDADEARIGTDPNNPDTDGDGYKDGEEVSKGFNPLGK